MWSLTIAQSISGVQDEQGWADAEVPAAAYQVVLECFDELRWVSQPHLAVPHTIHVVFMHAPAPPCMLGLRAPAEPVSARECRELAQQGASMEHMADFWACAPPLGLQVVIAVLSGSPCPQLPGLPAHLVPRLTEGIRSLSLLAAIQVSAPVTCVQALKLAALDRPALHVLTR